MVKDEELMEDPVFPSRNVQRVLLRVSRVNFFGHFAAVKLLLQERSTDILSHAAGSVTRHCGGYIVPCSSLAARGPDKS